MTYTRVTTEPDTSTRKPATVAQHIASELGETERAPKMQIYKLVRNCGTEQALAWLAAAQACEAAGGQMTHDGSRRRTLGGVFFAIARAEIDPALSTQIFPWRRSAGARQADRSMQLAQPILPPLDASEVAKLIADACQAPGKVTSVKITVIGRPIKVVERVGFALLVLEKDGSLPALPKGIPTPHSVPMTQYIVYVGAKQWARVREAIKDLDDVLICEGVPILEPRFNAITVFVTNATTKELQRKARETQQAKAAA